MKGLLPSSPTFPATLSAPKEWIHYCASPLSEQPSCQTSFHSLIPPPQSPLSPLSTALLTPLEPTKLSSPTAPSHSSPLPQPPPPHTLSSVSEPKATRSLKLRACRRVGARTLPNCEGGGASREPNCEGGGARLFLLFRPELSEAPAIFLFKVLNMATQHYTTTEL